ncbi:MAG: DNA photolyase family protein [Burkholderiaceae bacterium]|nr:DNA photolyase family protein [Burkholderiaceae bacterium]
MDSALVWFRRDLRFADHAALYHALRQARRVYCTFVFDRAILDELLAEGLTADRRVEFIHAALVDLDDALRSRGGALVVRHGFAVEEIPRLAAELQADAVFANHDYEPAAIARDAQVASALAAAGRRLLTFKDQVIFEKDEVLTAAGKPYTVFTPYKNAWLKRLTPFYVRPYPVERYAWALAQPARVDAIPTLERLGFRPTDLASLPLPTGASGGAQLFEEFKSRIDAYAQTRDFPALRGPSYLSTHLRFGTVSVRALVGWAWERWRETGSAGAAMWLSELIWREFYQQILYHHPHVIGHAFKREYDRIVWDDDPGLFAAWCEGRTGYPLVDAAMAQINRTGYMHNRLRMVVASFLAKDLGIDWRLGERYFARRLNDFDLASNNGNWQWAASTGCDAQPYFRIFHPVTQSEKFDPEGRFIKRYVPQLGGFTPKEIHAPWRVPPERQKAAGCVVGVDYPAPIVDHAQARAKTLARYAAVKR